MVRWRAAELEADPSIGLTRDELDARLASRPLIVSSATHFLIEHIHPFRDGNGRIGRLWQTLMLSGWRPIFAWMPTETMIRRSQDGYHEALQAFREPEIDAATFIDYMLGVITESVTAYAAYARSRQTDVGVNVGVIVGVREAVLALLRLEPTLSPADIAERLGKTSRTIERHLADLKAVGSVRREGSRKGGRWVVIKQ